jgi:hypothetical protein
MGMNSMDPGYLKNRYGSIALLKELGAEGVTADDHG